MSRDYEPQAGQWYEDLDNEEAFQVLSVDPDEEIIRIQWPDREIREIDLDQWNEMDLELAVAPEGWVDDVVEVVPPAGLDLSEWASTGNAVAEAFRATATPDLGTKDSSVRSLGLEL